MSRGVVLIAATAAVLVGWTSSPAAAATPIAWCGNDRATANRAPDPSALSSPNLVHVFYAIPADGADRFLSLASGIATDVGAIDSWWQRQDGSRTPRFDLYPFPGCTTRMGDLDITFVRLPQGSSAYAGTNHWQAVATDLGPVSAAQRKNLVFYDGPQNPSSASCGTSTSIPTAGGQFATSIVWLQSCIFDLGQGRFTAAVAAHELTHNLGAVAQGAPHNCASPNQGHACDSSDDLMWPFANAGTNIDSLALDVNHDDYYAHGGGWFDVQDSGWLMHLPLLPLTVSVAGTGTLASTNGAFSCATTCSTSIETGARVDLTATPGAGQRLVSWGGNCSGRAACSITGTGAQSVTATFGPATFALSVKVKGKGRVTSSPVGLACPKTCVTSFAADSAVRLIAKPAKGYKLSKWTGSCRGAGRCTVTVSKDQSVGATFVKKPKKKR
jgi:Divergent InlB B-repeat domain